MNSPRFRTPTKRGCKPTLGGTPPPKIYSCGCGKVYKSYPALYTHIRTKHDGIKPEGTITHSNSKTRRRGRKKKPGYWETKT